MEFVNGRWVPTSYTDVQLPVLPGWRSREIIRQNIASTLRQNTASTVRQNTASITRQNTASTGEEATLYVHVITDGARPVDEKEVVVIGARCDPRTYAERQFVLKRRDLICFN